MSAGWGHGTALGGPVNSPPALPASAGPGRLATGKLFLEPESIKSERIVPLAGLAVLPEPRVSSRHSAPSALVSVWVCTGVECLRPSWVPATLSPKAQGYSWDCLRRPHPCWKLLTERALEGCVVKMVLPQGGAWPFVYLLSAEDVRGVEDAVMGMLWPSQQWGPGRDVQGCPSGAGASVCPALCRASLWSPAVLFTCEFLQDQRSGGEGAVSQKLP